MCAQCYWMFHLSKVESKRCCLTAEPERRLHSSGKTATSDEEQIKVAEEYLVDVLLPAIGVQTFDELRVQVHKRRSELVLLLIKLPTSYSIRNVT